MICTPITSVNPSQLGYCLARYCANSLFIYTHFMSDNYIHKLYTEYTHKKEKKVR